MNQILLLAWERWSGFFQVSFTISFKVTGDDDDFIVRIKFLLLFSSLESNLLYNRVVT